MAARIIECSINVQPGKNEYLLETPEQAHISIYAHNNLIRITYWVDATTVYKKKNFIVVKTGESLPVGQSVQRNLGSVILNNQVYHIFEGYVR